MRSWYFGVVVLSISNLAYAKTSVPATEASLEQMRILEHMEPALRRPLHRSRSHAEAQKTLPESSECSEEAQACQVQVPSQSAMAPVAATKAESVTVSGQLSIVTSEGTQKLIFQDVIHDAADKPCFWPLGGRIEWTETNGTKHVAIFEPACASVILDDKALKLPARPHHRHDAPFSEPEERTHGFKHRRGA